MLPVNRPSAMQAVVWLVATTILGLALAPAMPDLAPVNDKVQHMAAFAALTIVACLGYPRAPFRFIFAGLALFGGLIEILQMIPALHRDAEFSDWLADILAIIAAYTVWKQGLQPYLFAHPAAGRSAKAIADAKRKSTTP